MKKVSLKPDDRMTALLSKWEDQVPVDSGPCGKHHQHLCTVNSENIITSRVKCQHDSSAHCHNRISVMCNLFDIKYLSKLVLKKREWDGGAYYLCSILLGCKSQITFVSYSV